MSKTLLCYHRDMDGYASAWVFSKWHAKEHGVDNPEHTVEYRSVQYSEPLGDIPEGTTDIVVVDFAYPREVCEELASKYKLRIIDHHVSAQAELAGLDYATYDLTLSGAELTWVTLFGKDVEVPEVIRYVGDYDLYKFALPDSREITAYLQTIGFDLAKWDSVTVAEAKLYGTPLWQQSQSLTKFLFKRGIWKDVVGGGKVYLANACTNHNEVCEMAYADPDCQVAAYFRFEGTKWLVGLRGNKGVPVHVIAGVFGGGGHAVASGFTIEGNINPEVVATTLAHVLSLKPWVNMGSYANAVALGRMQFLPMGNCMLKPAKLYSELVIEE